MVVRKTFRGHDFDFFFFKTLYHLFPLSIKWRYRASPSHWISSLTVVAWSFAISFCLFVIINKQKIKCVTMVVSVVWLVNAFNAFCLFVILWKILGIWLTQKKVSNVNYSLSRSLSTSLWKRSDFFLCIVATCFEILLLRSRLIGKKPVEEIKTIHSFSKMWHKLWPNSI